MVDRADLLRANQLSTEAQQIDEVLRVFAIGGRIASMTVATEEVEPGIGRMPPVSAFVPTTHIAYPAQMVDAIKAALDARHREIDAELDALGVTGTATRR